MLQIMSIIDLAVIRWKFISKLILNTHFHILILFIERVLFYYVFIRSKYKSNFDIDTRNSSTKMNLLLPIFSWEITVTENYVEQFKKTEPSKIFHYSWQ